MRTSNRLLDSRASAGFVLVAVVIAGIAAASCSDVTVEADGVASDASTVDDASVGDADTADLDAGSPSVPRPDAATSDAGPRPVACVSASCATALVLSTPPVEGRRGGFCALLEDKTVACWGENVESQLGQGADAGMEPSAVPRRVVGLKDIRYLASGCAIDGEGATWCWGEGPFLRSTTSAFTTEATPVKLPIPPATRVSVQSYYPAGIGGQYVGGCALTESGVLCWGMNQTGLAQFPDPNLHGTTPLPPRLIPELSGLAIQELVVGRAAFALRSDGTVLSWGVNTTLARVSSLYPDPHPFPTALGRGVSMIDVVDESACAVVQGLAYCWGGSPYVTSGPPDVTGGALPRYVPTPEPVVDIATTSSSVVRMEDTPIARRACAVGVSGDVYCWGRNAYGEAGDGTRQFAYQPVKVVGLPAPASRVKVSSTATCALLTNGKIYCWGNNVSGQLGNGRMKEPSVTPQEVLLP